MKFKSLLLVLALQSAWILGTVAVQERVLIAGKVVLLETRPVDPRDLLRGDFLILNYKISDVPANLFSPTVGKDLPVGATVFVALEQRGQFYEIAKASTDPFEPSANQILLKGKSVSRRWGAPAQNTNPVHIEYGIERYYVHEGTGSPRGKITVEAAVSASGSIVIKQVFLDGKPYAEVMKQTVQ